MLILRTLDWIGIRATWMLAAGVFLGIAWQPLADVLAPWLEELIILNLSLSMMRIKPAQFISYLRQPFVIAAVFVFSMIVAPMGLWGLTRTIGVPGELGDGMVFHALTTPIMSAPALCILFGLDAALALVITVLSYALVPLTLPPLALWLLGIHLDVSALELAWRLGSIVGVSFVIAAGARLLRGGPAAIERYAPQIDGILVLGMVGVAVSLMSGLPDFALSAPGYTAVATGIAFAANLGLQFAGGAVFWWLGRRAAVTVALITGNTNVALVFAAVSQGAPYELLVYFVVGQFPIYTLPLIAVPIYRRIVQMDRGIQT